MAIEIKNLEQFKDVFSDKPYYYKDLSLDLSTTRSPDPGQELPLPGIDIRASFDLQAIINSLTNLFNTMPGQRILFPKYGLNLKSYLFAPITATTGKMLGQNIYDSIKNFEPRVGVNLVDVTAIADEQIYKITISIEIPLFKQQTQIDFVFDTRRQTFTSLPVK